MAQDMRAHGARDAGGVRYGLDDALHLPARDPEGVVQREVSLDERTPPIAHRYDPDLGLFPVRAALAVNGKAMPLPVDLVAGEAGEFGDPQTGVEQRPDDRPLPPGPARIRELGRFIWKEGLPSILVGHVANYN